MNIRRALGVTGASQLAGFIAVFASIVVVSRLLTPEEIGVFSVSVSVLGFAHIFREFGVAKYLVQAATVGPREFRAAFSVTLLCSWCIALILFFGRIPLSSFYGHEGIAEVLALLSFNFVILPFGAPLLSLLRRELRFNTLAGVSVTTEFVSAGVTIGAALLGESYLSMAWGAVFSHIARVAILNFLRPGEIFVLPSLRGVREVTRFGSITSATSVISEIGQSAPDLIMGRTLGFAEVAFFSRADGLRRMLLKRVSKLVGGVHFPTFARRIRDGGNPAEMYADAMSYMVAVTAPLLAVLAVLAGPLILFLFGDQWERSVPLAMMLCAFAIVGTPYGMYGQSLTAAGRINLHLASAVATQAVRVCVVLTSIWLELEYVVALLGVAALTGAVCAQMALYWAFGLTAARLLARVGKALLLVPFAAAGPAVVVWVASGMGVAEDYRFLVLAAGGSLAVGGWIIGVFLLGHEMKDEVRLGWGKLRHAIAGRA